MGMFNIIKIVEIKNQKRDLVLNISREGFHLTPCRRKLLLKRDYIPLSQGVWFALALLALFLGTLPLALDGKQGLAEWSVCAGCAGFALFALATDIYQSIAEIREMRAYIKKAVRPRDVGQVTKREGNDDDDVDLVG